MDLIDALSSSLKINKSTLQDFCTLAPNKYRIYSIPKRNSGYRIIAHPSKELKKYQRTLNDLIKNILPVHSSAFAYRNGLDIKKNALRHAKNPYLLKMDFHDFFNRITPDVFWKQVGNKFLSLTRKDADIFEKLIFWNRSKKNDGKLILSVGAPTSPLISNSVMYNFDCSISEWCVKNDITYTRYADDITFSTRKKNILFTVPEKIKNEIIMHFGNAMLINDGKTIFSSKAHNRHITGITITNEGIPSLGREKKRYIYHLLHQYSLNLLEHDDILHLKGQFSFSCYIDKSLMHRAEKKYSSELVQKLIHYV
ncbi:retron St85 family RNA-directed DNA polymerase [Aeromonas dhakensis]|uniref:retron St85 family RNA-directed DNA polymerase n=1 Tax=Aeromonas dhakensis TaxID=196024 RepID=UPI0009E61F60|nr:retron St85 family RNA-directed DNA polymerase [Aeromonas dhakensis]